MTEAESRVEKALREFLEAAAESGEEFTPYQLAEMTGVAAQLHVLGSKAKEAAAGAYKNRHEHLKTLAGAAASAAVGHASGGALELDPEHAVHAASIAKTHLQHHIGKVASAIKDAAKGGGNNSNS